MKKRTHSYSAFELAVIATLILLTSYKAFQLHSASLVGLGHMLFLFTVFLILRLLIGLVSTLAGQLFFALSCTVLIIELLIQTFSDFHLNPFIISLVMQPGASAHIGAPLWLLVPILGAVFIAAYRSTCRFSQKTYPLNVVLVSFTFLLSVSTSQLLHAYMFFSGHYEVVHTRRNLPFFFKPHHYYMFKVMEPFVEGIQWSPLTQPNKDVKYEREKRQEPTFSNPKNVLLIIADSLRSTEIRNTPELIPNITHWAADGWINYDHYSTSNCTFNSVYSMFTSKLPTSFSASRAAGYEHSLFDTLLANNYAVSISEASPLDWFGLAQMIIPEAVERTILSDDDFTQNDAEVTDHSLERLAAVGTGEKPYFHIAYYYGNHYPYAGSSGDRQTSYQDYLNSIPQTDKEIGRLLDTLLEQGLLEDTIIIITSDHGEEFAENGRFFGHSSRLNNDQTVVPFMVVGDGKAQRQSVKSHLDFKRYVTLLLEHGPSKELAPADDPIILAGCGEGYPDNFAVITDTGRVDFTNDDGYLAPLRAGPVDARQQHREFVALNQLLAAIKLNDEK